MFPKVLITTYIFAIHRVLRCTSMDRITLVIITSSTDCSLSIMNRPFSMTARVFSYSKLLFRRYFSLHYSMKSRITVPGSLLQKGQNVIAIVLLPDTESSSISISYNTVLLLRTTSAVSSDNAPAFLTAESIISR